MSCNLSLNIDSDLSLKVGLKVDSDETKNDGVETVLRMICTMEMMLDFWLENSVQMML